MSNIILTTHITYTRERPHTNTQHTKLAEKEVLGVEATRFERN